MGTLFSLVFFPIEKKLLLFDNKFIYGVHSILVRENSILFSLGVRENSIILHGKGQGKSGNFFFEKVYERCNIKIHCIGIPLLEKI